MSVSEGENPSKALAAACSWNLLALLGSLEWLTCSAFAAASVPCQAQWPVPAWKGQPPRRDICRAGVLAPSCYRWRTRQALGLYDSLAEKVSFPEFDHG